MHLFFITRAALCGQPSPAGGIPLLSKMRLRSGVIQDHMDPGDSLSGIVIGVGYI